MKDIDTIIELAKKLNELIDLVAHEEINIDDLIEVKTISPGLEELVGSFKNWVNGNIATPAPALVPETVKTEEPKPEPKPKTPKRATKTVTKRGNIPNEELIKIGVIIRDSIPEKGVRHQDTGFRKKLVQNLGVLGEKYLTSPSVLYRILTQYQSTYRKVLSKYYRIDGAMLYKNEM